MHARPALDESNTWMTPAGCMPSRSMTAREARLCTSVNATIGRSGWCFTAQASAARPISVA